MKLAERIEIEKQITDDKEAKMLPPSIGPGWTFSDYRDRLPWREYKFEFLGPLAGKSILDLGCGYFPTPIYFALAGATVVATDVSPKAVAYIEKLAKKFGVSDRVSMVLCPAEKMPFEDATFDLVHGEGALHHFDLDLAAVEIRRVLKSGGKGAFKDPLGQNLLLKFIRDYIPYEWKNPDKGTDSPLKFRDIDRFGQVFSSYSYQGFGFFSMAVIALFGRRDSRLQRAVNRLDKFMLRVLPFLQRYCRFVVTLIEK
jgi:ubiquinone/menaquinone biosynthesis C-methylase UbiE